MKNRKTQLALGVASAAIISSIAAPAHAACTVDDSTVTCTADSTAAEVNTAMATVVGDDVTLNVATGAGVVQPGSDVSPSQQGAVAIDNAGDLGVEAAPVGVFYVGSSADEANTFGLENSGTITDRVEVYNVGGATSISNSGLLGNGITVSTTSDGPVTVTSTGDIDSAFDPGVDIYTRGDIDISVDGNVGTPATATDASDLRSVTGNSQQFASDPTTSETETAGTATTTTTTSGYTNEGGSVSIALAESANSGSVSASGLGGAAVSIDGAVGSETQSNSVNAFSGASEGSTTTVGTVDGADSSTTTQSTTTAIGGNASVAVGETGSVSSFVQANGLESADIVVDGSVGSEAAPAGAFASSVSTDSATTNSSAVTGTVSTSSTDQSSTTVGGVASVAVGETGVVTGGVNASGAGGASVSIDGSVGLPTSTSFANANSTGTASTFQNASEFDGATGANSYAETGTSSSNGGDAAVTVGAASTANAGINASANGDATVANAGTVTGSVSANALGTDSENGFSNENDGAGNASSASFTLSTETGGNASIDNAAGGLIGLDATAPISVTTFGDTSASVSNAGRINGSVTAQSSAFANADSDASSFISETDAATGVVTTVSTTDEANSTTSLGGDASFANAAGGLVTGSVDVQGAGNAEVVNEGAVIGTTYAASLASDDSYSRSAVNTDVFVPGADGGTTITRADEQVSSQTSSGGDVTATYAGTNGAVQFAPFGGASDGSVTQQANGDSSAIVSGTIFGGFTGNATGSESGFTYAEVRETTFDADGDQRSFERSYTYGETDRISADSDSLLAVDGGRIEGNASLYATGSADAQIGNGGAIDGSLSLTAQAYGGYDYSEANDQAREFDEDGNFLGETVTFAESSQRVVNSGTVSVAIGEGTVGGSVTMSGTAGSNSFALAAEGSVGGSVSQQGDHSLYGYDRTTVTAITPTDTVQTIDYAETNTASGGDVTAIVEGVIGNGDLGPQAYGDIANAGGTDLFLSTDAGNATATVAGQVRDGISVNANGSDTTYAYQQTLENGATTAYAEQSSSTATGGTASLAVDAADRDVPANFGDIAVAGRSGSSVAIGGDSSVLAATNGAFMQVGGYFADTTFSRDDTYTGGVLTSQATTFSSVTVGGDATLLNDGRIGYDGGAAFDGDAAFVSIVSPTNADATNNGQIFGSIALDSLFENVASTTTRTDLDDVTRVDTTDRTYAASGGSALLTNTGLVTGDASLAAVDGTVVNSGVLRGDLALGRSVDNYTTQSTDTLTQAGEEEVLDLAAALEQGYAVEQNGLLGGTITLSGVFGQIDDTVRTSTILGTINLNSGSVTGGGIVAEYDEETGERFTQTNVNLNGAGYLGLGDAALAALTDSFADVDPGIEAAGDLSAYAGGARILGVDTLTKTGDGVFLITGADYAPVSNTNGVADYTLDLGSFAITGGEIQLATAGDEGVFGIRGDIANSAGLVLGSRVTIPAPLFGINASVTAIDGVEVYQNGDFVQAGSGTLSVGMTPTLVRVVDPAFSGVSTSTNPLAVQQIGLASGLFTTPENAFGQAFADLGTGFLTIDGNLDLGGTVQLVSPTGGIFTDGQTVDIASVSGTVTTGADVAVSSASNFVTFDLGTRTEGGRTIVFVSADRAGFEAAGENANAIATGTALSQAFPDVLATIQAGSAGGIGIAGDQFVLAQDLANIFVGFDTLLTMDQASRALNELASGEFYGSLTTLETTAPFVDAISTARVAGGASGFNMWFAPSGDFIEIEGDSGVGSADIQADNYGASAGFGMATGNGEIGIGFGYGRINADSREGLLTARADTWMLGAYTRQAFGNFAVAADLVYGWSDWNAARVMPTMSRSATGEFNSTELRGDLRAEYMLDFGGGWVAPFGQLSFRKFDLDGFTEEGAGAVNLVVEDADDTVLTPSLGLRMGTSFETAMAVLRPEVTLSYSFDDGNSSFRDVAYLGSPQNSFRLQGVDPEGYFTIGAGLFADIGDHSGAFLRGSYATGGGIDAASANAGVTIGF